TAARPRHSIVEGCADGSAAGRDSRRLSRSIGWIVLGLDFLAYRSEAGAMGSIHAWPMASLRRRRRHHLRSGLLLRIRSRDCEYPRPLSTLESESFTSPTHRLDCCARAADANVS